MLNSNVAQRNNVTDDEGAAEEETLVDKGSPSDGSQPNYNSIDAFEENNRMRHQPTELREEPVRRLSSNLWEDARELREGSIPQSVVVGVVIAIACGFGAYLYYFLMTSLVEILWHELPERYVVGVWPEWAHGLYIPLIGFFTALGLGVSVVALGEPGDMAYTIDCVHNKAFIHMSHIMPMCITSLISIVGGASVGPEAPLVAICAALGGNISRYIFKQTNKNVVRKHTLMGMGGALAAFFGAPLGGSLFALEICSKFDIEYFEHAIETILCGVICTCVFRSLAALPIGQIWSNQDTTPLESADSILIATGALIGLAGAFVAFLFMQMHFKVVGFFQHFGLMDNKQAVKRALLGGSVVYTIGMLVPHTMFFGDVEFQTIWNMSPSNTLERVFPTSGIIGFEMDTFYKCFMVGFLKLVTISFSVAGGYRGGFIFPLFSSGAAFGRAMLFIFPKLPPTVTCLSFAAGINVAVTKTSMSSTLLLAYLSGEQNGSAAILAASISSLLVSAYVPFIKTQVSRDDQNMTLHGLTQQMILAMKVQLEDEKKKEEEASLGSHLV